MGLFKRKKQDKVEVIKTEQLEEKIQKGYVKPSTEQRIEEFSKSLGKLASSKKLELLIVEDSPEYLGWIRKYQSQYEEKCGIKISIAETFLEYKELVAQKEFDMVVTDMFIPYSKGEESDSEVKKLWKEITGWAKEKHPHGLESYDGPKGRKIGQIEEMPYKIEELLEGKSKYYLDYFAAPEADSIYHSKKRYTPTGKEIECDEQEVEELKKRAEAEMIKTGPFGARIFEEQFYLKKKPVVIATSDHFHGYKGSFVMAYMQSYLKEKYGLMPFFSLGGLSLTLSADHAKVGEPEEKVQKCFERTIQSCLFQQKLVEAGLDEKEREPVLMASTHFQAYCEPDEISSLKLEIPGEYSVGEVPKYYSLIEKGLEKLKQIFS